MFPEKEKYYTVHLYNLSSEKIMEICGWVISSQLNQLYVRKVELFEENEITSQLESFEYVFDNEADAAFFRLRWKGDCRNNTSTNVGG